MRLRKTKRNTKVLCRQSTPYVLFYNGIAGKIRYTHAGLSELGEETVAADREVPRGSLLP